MKHLSLPIAIFFAFTLSAQDLITIQNGCSFNGTGLEAEQEEFYTFDPSNEASKIVKQILDGAGALSYNSFILKESDVKNALATKEGKNRYILYSVTFLEKFKGDANTKWAAYTVLAHEIGHHLNGHDFTEKDPKIRKRMELEADIFAGSICRTLKATFEEALAGMESMQLEGETATHPDKKARVAAIANGWKKQDELLKGEPAIAGEVKEIDSAMESLSGKIFQRYLGIETILLSAKTKEYDASIDEITFNFLVQNPTNAEIEFKISIHNGEVTKTSMTTLESYYIPFSASLESEGLKDDRYYNYGIGTRKIASQTSSNFKLTFRCSKSDKVTGPIVELRATIAVNGQKKALSFKNIPLPYELKP